MGKNILIHLGVHDVNPIDLAVDYIKEGDNIFFLACDENVSPCLYNRCGNLLQCKMCKKLQKQLVNKYIKNNYELHYISEYINSEINYEAGKLKFKYNNTQELKNITYKGVEIGYGAFSTYVTLTRHSNPLYNDDVKNYLSHLMKNEIKTILVIENIIDNFNPDLIIFHNGRFAQYKPFLNIAQKKGINFIATEILVKPDGIERKNNFFNDIPHSISSATNSINRDWDNENSNIREQIGKTFFENRRNGKYAGDKIYTKNQEKGKLPKNWDNRKNNIVIFNSSEDEYVSISREYDNNRLFKNQYEALINIFEHYKNDITKHFYVRIHPNLSNVDDISHLALYKLKYPNITIIPPSSDISTYSLLDFANKIIVFNSTTGAEASYWGKAVIALDLCAYSNLDIVYSPKRIEELYTLIDDLNLKCKKNDNIIKLGFFYMRNNYKPNKYIPHIWKKFKFLGHEINYSQVFQIFGSSKFYAITSYLSINVLPKLKLFSKFKKVPNDRDLWNLDIKN